MNILVVAAHPDDEVLGCGGTMARHAAAGDTVHVLFLADGETSRPPAAETASAVAGREQAAQAAAAVLGAQAPRFAGLPDNRLDTVALLDVVQRVEAVVAETRPDTVYTHHSGDLNVDHRIAHQAVLTACRPLPGSPVTALYAFEVASSTEWASPRPEQAFLPTRFVDISGFLEVKLKALECYGEEMRPFPHARSLEGIEAQARLRGVGAGMEAAEAFVVVRERIV